MAIDTDVSISSAGVIDYTGAAHGAAGAGYYTVLELHEFLRQLADDEAASGDDLVDITTATPSDRSTDNIITVTAEYTITDTMIEHLYDGTIIQDSDGTRWDGVVVIAAEGMDLQVVQNGAILANDFWNTIPNGQTTKGLNRDSANGISHRFLIKTVNAGTDIDGRRLLGQTRVTGKTYSEFKINGTGQGNNVMALTYADDLNDTEDASGWTTITNVEGYQPIDVNNDGADEYFYSKWNKDTYTINQLYERLKYISRQGTSDTLYGLNGELFRGITHEVPLGGGTPSGTFTEPEAVSWGSGASAGTGQLLAIDDTAAASATTMWIQLLTGVAPSTGVTITGGSSSATADCNATPTERTISTPFIGVSTGSSIIGAYGLGIEYSDISASDKVFDLTNTQYSPPNNVQFTVNGLIAGEDRILVGPANGSALRSDQFQLNSGITAGASSITVTSGSESAGSGTDSAIDTPSAGSIRVLGDDNIFYRVTYTGYTVGAGTMTFTGCSGAPTASANNDVFISYIDKLATSTDENVTVTYSGNDRSVFIRDRDGGASPIKTFESTGTIGSGGGSTTVIRTSDA